MTGPRAVRAWRLAADSPTTACVGAARTAVAAAATSWGVGGEGLDDLLCVVSELVANAVRHAPGPLSARVRFAPDGTRVLIEVSDTGSSLPRLVAGASELFAESGRGMLMVAALAERWGARPDDGGKTVWCELLLPAAPAVPGPGRTVRAARAAGVGRP
ncbi:ATP-binding protein [Kitasatospora sp. NBC_00240]|uniref:ATP-binding protein n=1 Tax=Kitasatospora sp. NBC_00240 TaxID=2903567 RepID=UPI002256195A|nr:ATP-binding protein [Kitasatospora sp. NBC_00240]MCX5213488.1 ATP-binding protein [Kitasatospora sp. NBC_00240]